MYVDHLINENLISKLQIKLPSEEFLMIRLKQICKEKNIKFDFPNEIPGNLGNSIGAPSATKTDFEVGFGRTKEGVAKTSWETADDVEEGILYACTAKNKVWEIKMN